eukprot:gene8609-1023_t
MVTNSHRVISNTAEQFVQRAIQSAFTILVPRNVSLHRNIKLGFGVTLLMLHDQHLAHDMACLDHYSEFNPDYSKYQGDKGAKTWNCKDECHQELRLRNGTAMKPNPSFRLNKPSFTTLPQIEDHFALGVPCVVSVASKGPATGLIRKGDVVLAVNGNMHITSHELLKIGTAHLAILHLTLTHISNPLLGTLLATFNSREISRRGLRSPARATESDSSTHIQSTAKLNTISSHHNTSRVGYGSTVNLANPSNKLQSRSGLSSSHPILSVLPISSTNSYRKKRTLPKRLPSKYKTPEQSLFIRRDWDVGRSTENAEFPSVFQTQIGEFSEGTVTSSSKTKPTLLQSRTVPIRCASTKNFSTAVPLATHNSIQRRTKDGKEKSSVDVCFRPTSMSVSHNYKTGIVKPNPPCGFCVDHSRRCINRHYYFEHYGHRLRDSLSCTSQTLQKQQALLMNRKKIHLNDNYDSCQEKTGKGLNNDTTASIEYMYTGGQRARALRHLHAQRRLRQELEDTRRRTFLRRGGSVPSLSSVLASLNHNTNGSQRSFSLTDKLPANGKANHECIRNTRCRWRFRWRRSCSERKDAVVLLSYRFLETPSNDFSIPNSKHSDPITNTPTRQLQASPLGAGNFQSDDATNCCDMNTYITKKIPSNSSKNIGPSFLHSTKEVCENNPVFKPVSTKTVYPFPEAGMFRRSSESQSHVKESFNYRTLYHETQQQLEEAVRTLSLWESLVTTMSPIPSTVTSALRSSGSNILHCSGTSSDTAPIPNTKKGASCGKEEDSVHCLGNKQLSRDKVEDRYARKSKHNTEAIELGEHLRQLAQMQFRLADAELSRVNEAASYLQLKRRLYRATAEINRLRRILMGTVTSSAVTISNHPSYENVDALYTEETFLAQNSKRLCHASEHTELRSQCCGFSVNYISQYQEGKGAQSQTRSDNKIISLSSPSTSCSFASAGDYTQSRKKLFSII